MAKKISECLSDWDAWEPPINPNTKLHIPTMWELASQAREINGGGRRIVLVDHEVLCYVLVGNIGEDFALDVYVTDDMKVYAEMLGVCDSMNISKTCVE